MLISVTGIDPGLVHTGVVNITLFTETHEFLVTAEAFDSIVDAKGNAQVDTQAVADFAIGLARKPAVFIEAYRPRSHLQNDARMGAAVNELKRLIPGSVALDNTGVKKVITKDLMELLGVWQFTTRTHHQDLRAAARIGLYGLVKNDAWNAELASLVSDHLQGKPWRKL